MKFAPIPPDETARLCSLAEYNVLDTPPEQLFDDLTALAAFICGVPFALVSIVDENRQWFKSAHGIEAVETPRDISFCGHVVALGEALYVPDALQDERFHDNPLVIGEMGLRFYAGQPVLDPDGHVLGTICVLDRRPRTLSEAQTDLLAALARQVSTQLELRREIVRRKKLEAVKDEFISTVSHELRTPLTSIRGALGLVVGGALGDLPPKFASMLEIAANNADRLVRLINDILDVEKMESGAELRRERVNLVDLCQTAIDENAGFARGYGVRFELHADDPNVNVFADRDRMRQVADNLLSNAAKYSPNGASVNVRVLLDGPNARVEVSDTGNGIPPEFESRIFQRFAQADSSDTRRRGGTGLGLAIAKQIVDDHGGQIGFDSTPGVGSTFFFILPCADPTPVATVDVPPDAHVLVVEDDVPLATLLEQTLQSKGYRVTVAHRAATAIEHLRNGRFDAITLDLGLPDDDGFSVIRMMRDTPAVADVPVIVVSGMADRRALGATGPSSAVSDWIVKPFDPNRLLAAVTLAAKSRTGVPMVLHVESDDDLAAVIATCLSGLATIERATSIAQAQELVSTTPFDLIVLDLELPDGDGRELLAELNEQMPEVPIVIFSALVPEPALMNKVQSALIKSRQSEHDLVATIVELLDKR